MNELTISALVLGYIAVFALAHSPRPFVRGLGLLGLLAAAVGLLGGAAFMLWGAFIAPKFNGGIGNMAMAFLALPLGLFGALAAMLMRTAWRYIPGAAPDRFSTERLRQVWRLTRGGTE